MRPVYRYLQQCFCSVKSLAPRALPRVSALLLCLPHPASVATAEISGWCVLYPWDVFQCFMALSSMLQDIFSKPGSHPRDDNNSPQLLWRTCASPYTHIACYVPSHMSHTAWGTGMTKDPGSGDLCPSCSLCHKLGAALSMVSLCTVCACLERGTHFFDNSLSLQSQVCAFC